MITIEEALKLIDDRRFQLRLAASDLRRYGKTTEVNETLPEFLADIAEDLESSLQAFRNANSDATLIGRTIAAVVEKEAPGIKKEEDIGMGVVLELTPEEQLRRQAEEEGKACEGEPRLLGAEVRRMGLRGRGMSGKS